MRAWKESELNACAAAVRPPVVLAGLVVPLGGGWMDGTSGGSPHAACAYWWRRRNERTPRPTQAGRGVSRNRCLVGGRGGPCCNA